MIKDHQQNVITKNIGDDGLLSFTRQRII